VGPQILRARAELIYQSQQFVNRTAILAIPSRALLNVGLTSRLLSSPEVVAALEVKNATNLFTQDFDGYPLPSRAAYLTLSIAVEPNSRRAASNQTRAGEG